jgi:cyclase
VHLNGGRVPTELDLFAWAVEAQARGAGEILFTSMDHDGVQQGFALAALAQLSGLLRIPVIASGGAGTMAHFADAFTVGHADAALAASVFHDGMIGLPALKSYLAAQGIVVRA